MTLALHGKSRKRRGGLLLAALLAVMAAAMGGLMLAGVAFAHTASYSATAQCDASWTALGQYIAGSSSNIGDRRLVVLHLASVNGSVVPTGSANLAANQNFSSGPDGSNGLVLKTLYGGSLTGATVASGDYIWVGAQGTTGTLFNMSGGPGSLDLSAGSWAGTITLYSWDGSKWVVGNSGDNKAITAPPAATGCGKIHVKKVVTGAGAPAQGFTADINNADGSEGDLSNLAFSAAAEGLDSFTGNANNDDFTVTEDSPPANWTLTGVAVFDGNHACPAADGTWAAAGTASISNLRKDHGNEVTVCFRNMYNQPQVLLPSVAKTQDNPAIDATKAHWTITINNSAVGTVAQPGFNVIDAGATLDSVSTAGACGTLPDTDGNFTCNVAATSTLVLHVSKPLSLATNANNKCLPGTIDNTATAFLATGSPITVTATNTTITVPATADSSCLKIAKTQVNNGDGSNTYTITVTNTGPATTAVVKDSFSNGGTGATLVDPVTVTSTPASPACLVANLTGAAGCTVNIAAAPGLTTLVVSSTAYTNTTCGPLTMSNNATGTWQTVGGPSITVTTTAVTRVYTGVTCTPGLSISKSGPATVAQGGSISYTLDVTNSGTASTSGTSTMKDTLPNGLTVVHASGSGWTCDADIPGPTSGSSITCTSTAVIAPAGHFPQITFTATAPANVCTPIDNVASATGGGGGDAIHNSNTVTTQVTDCGRKIRIGKVTDTATHANQDFVGTIAPGTPATFSVNLPANSLAGPINDYAMNSQTAETVVETPVPTNWTLVGYNVTSDPNGTSQCSNTMSFSTAANANVVPAGAGTYLVCIKNNLQTGRIIVEKLNLGGTQTDTFSGSFGDGNTFNTLAPGAVGNTPGPVFETGLPYGTSLTVTEDAKAGYTYTGYYIGHCDTPNQVLHTGNYSATIGAGSDDLNICLVNQAERHITIIKKVDNVDNDTTDFGIKQDNQVADLGVISESGHKIETTIDTAEHTFLETVAPGYSFVDAFESDADCNNIESDEGTAVNSSYVLDAGTGDVIICFVNHRDPVHIKVIKNYILHGATFNPLTDIPVMHVFGPSEQLPGNDGANPTNYNTVDVAAGSISTVESIDTTRWKFVSVELSGQGCELLNLEEQLAGDTQLLLALEAQLVGGFDFTAAPDATCTVTYTNELQIGHLQVHKTDGTGGLTGRPASWTFSVAGPGGPYVFNIPLGGGDTAVVDVPLGGPYTAIETNGNTGQCPDPNEDPNAWRTQAIDGPLTLVNPGDTIVFHFSNQPCDVILGSGNLIVHKYGDLNGNHTLDAGEVGLAGWTINVKGPEFPAGQDFVTDASGTVFLPGITDGLYTITETNQAGYTVIGVVNVNTSTFTPGTVGTATVALGGETVVNFFNEPLVNIHVTKTEVTAAGTGPGAGWAITVKGCGNTYGPTNTNASGVADFNNLPPCATGYTVSENTLSKAGFAAVGASSVVVAGNVPGTTYNVSFENIQFTPGCTSGCITNNPTPTPTPPTPTPTVKPPTATPTTVPPTATPTKNVDIVEGAKTPGPGTTPIAPSTGSGFFGTSGGSTNTLMALFGLFALSGGLATLAISRRKSRS